MPGLLLWWRCTNTPMRYTSITSTTNGPLHSSKSNTSSSSCSGSNTTSTVPSQHLLDHLQVTTPSSATISPSAPEASLAQPQHCGNFATVSKIGKSCTVFKLGETVYSGPASSHRCGARPDDVGTREAEAPSTSAETSHSKSSSDPASHHTLCTLSVSTSTSPPPLLPNSCSHASNLSPPNSSKANGTLNDLEFGELSTKNTASLLRDGSTGRSFEASLRELNLTCSNRSISSSPSSIVNTNIEVNLDSSSIVHKPVQTVVTTSEDVSFPLDQSSFSVNVLFNNNNTSSVHDVNGYSSDTKERSRGIVAGCKAGPRSRVKRLSTIINSSLDSEGESQTHPKELSCSDPSRVKSEDCFLVSNSISLSSPSVSNSVGGNEPKSVVDVDIDQSVDKPYVLGNELIVTTARLEVVSSNISSESYSNCGNELVRGQSDAINDVDYSGGQTSIPSITSEEAVEPNPTSKSSVSELKISSTSRRSSVSSGEISTGVSSPEFVIALTEGDPLQLDVAEASSESAILTVSSIDSGLSVSDPNNSSATENGSVVAIADSPLTPSDDESSNSEIVISCGSVITDVIPTHSQRSTSAYLPGASILPSASNGEHSTEKEKASDLEHTNRNEGVQKKAVKSIIQVKQVARPRRSPRTSPLGTPLSSPHNTPRNSPLPPVDTSVECDTNDVSQSACGRSLRSRTLSSVAQSEKLDTIVEDTSETVAKELQVSACSSTNFEAPESNDSTVCASENPCTSDKTRRENAVVSIKPVACHTRSSISKPCNGLEKPLNSLVNSSNKFEGKETCSVETPICENSKKVQNGDFNPIADRPLHSSSDQTTSLCSGRNSRRNSVPVPAPNSHCKSFLFNSVSLVATNSSPPSRRTTRSLSSDCSSYSNNNNKLCSLNASRQSSLVPVVTVSSSPTTSVATTLSHSGNVTVVSSSHGVTKTRHHSTAQERISSCTSTKSSVDDTNSSKVNLPLPDSGLPSREMVRLIQDHSNSFDSYCKRRGNRSSRRLCSADTFLESEKSQSKLLSLRKHGRSDSYFSESEDSCGGVEDVALRNGRSTGHTKASPGAGTNGLGIHLFEKMATRNTSKSVTDALNSNVDSVNHNALGFPCTGNGTESLRQRLLNGSTAGRLSSKNKHRSHRSALVSDDSDCSSTISKSNGLDKESDKVDINLLLEISVADRDKFEKKKSKLRKKNADWCLISETEKIINEKEEILKNKNRPDSSTDDESDEDDEDEPLRSRRLESRIASKILVDHNSSEDSDSNFFVPERKKSCRKTNKKYESFKLDSKASELPKKEIKSDTSKSVEHTKDTGTSNVPADNSSSKPTEGESIPVSRPKGRPKGSRNRRTLYDLTRLNEDTDDDNFFSFPVNSGLGQSPVTVGCRDRRSSRSNTARLNGGDQHGSNTSKKRLSDAERFLRDNREYYQFPETRERLRTSHERSDGEKVRPDDTNTSNYADDDRLSGKEEISRKSRRGRPVSPCPENCKVSSTSCAPLKTNTRKGKFGRFAGKRLRPKGSEDELVEELPTPENNSSEKPCQATVSEKIEHKEEEANFSDGGSVSAVIPCCTGAVDQIVFSFEHVPKAEPWYQTYKRQVDGNKDHEYSKEEDYLRFVLPYEMPKEYFRDPLAKRNLANKKRADLAELARKSPRCHASTLALFSDILPCKKKQSKRAKSHSSAREEDQCTSDGTSTPGTDSNSRLPLTEHFETLDDFIAIEHCMNVLLRAAQQRRDLPSMEELKDDLSREAAGAIDPLPPKEETEVKPDPDCKRELRDGTRKDKRDVKEKAKEKDETSDDEETDPKKETSRRRKRKRLCSSSSTTSNSNRPIKSEKPEGKSKVGNTHTVDFLKGLKLENDPLASEVDPQFLVEMQDFYVDKSQSSSCSTLDMSVAELCAHATSCKCANVPQYHCYDDVSSVDGNTEVSSECLSLVDSENLDTASFSKVHVKKRRKNLTGWPKIKKKRMTPTVPTSEDNDSALGFDDHISRKSKRTVKADQVLTAADDSERRASPRKKVAPLDAVPLRLRSAK